LREVKDQMLFPLVTDVRGTLAKTPDLMIEKRALKYNILHTAFNISAYEKIVNLQLMW
jgi:hypothetical protein